MTYNIIWHPRALDDLAALEKHLRERINEKVRQFRNNPSHFAQRLAEENLYKLRIGDYRIILEIIAERKLIKIVLVAHRSRVYKQLDRI